jgi:hypothetical protein
VCISHRRERRAPAPLGLFSRPPFRLKNGKAAFPLSPKNNYRGNRGTRSPRCILTTALSLSALYSPVAAVKVVLPRELHLDRRACGESHSSRAGPPRSRSGGAAREVSQTAGEAPGDDLDLTLPFLYSRISADEAMYRHEHAIVPRAGALLRGVPPLERRSERLPGTPDNRRTAGWFGQRLADSRMSPRMRPKPLTGSLGS